MPEQPADVGCVPGQLLAVPNALEVPNTDRSVVAARGQIVPKDRAPFHVEDLGRVAFENNRRLPVLRQVEDSDQGVLTGGCE